MLSAYDIINEASNEGTINAEDFDIEFQQICGKNNINIIVLDTQTRTIKTSVNDYEVLSRQLLDYLFKKNEAQYDRVLAKEENYEMYIELDMRTRFEYVDMWGVLDNGNLFCFEVLWKASGRAWRSPIDFLPMWERVQRYFPH